MGAKTIAAWRELHPLPQGWRYLEAEDAAPGDYDCAYCGLAASRRQKDGRYFRSMTRDGKCWRCKHDPFVVLVSTELRHPSEDSESSQPLQL